VNEALKEVLSEGVGELKDPRIGFVTVTGVETSADLRHARVFVSVLGSERKRERSLAGLTAAHGVLQARIGRELRMKRTPQLTFEYAFMALDGLGRRWADDAESRVLVAVDCASETRVVDTSVLERATLVVDVDHHHDNSRFGDVNLIVPDASSTAEVLRDVF